MYKSETLKERETKINIYAKKMMRRKEKYGRRARAREDRMKERETKEEGRGEHINEKKEKE